MIQDNIQDIWIDELKQNTAIFGGTPGEHKRVLYVKMVEKYRGRTISVTVSDLLVEYLDVAGFRRKLSRKDLKQYFRLANINDTDPEVKIIHIIPLR